MAKAKSREMADGIMASIADIEAMMRDGVRPEDRFTVHTLSIPKPGKYNPAAVRKLREQLGMSQAVFGELIGISRNLVQGWELGTRVPSPLACRLLDTITDDPAGWLAHVQRKAFADSAKHQSAQSRERRRA